MTRVITAPTKHNCEHLLGQFLDESHYDLLIEEDCDFYAPNNSLMDDNGEHNIIFKFRKNAFNAEEQRGVYEGLIGAAGESQNRGQAAGPKGEKLGGREWVTDWQLAVLDSLMNSKPRLDGQDPLDVLIAEKGKFKEESTRGLVWLRSKIISEGESYEGFFDRWLEAVMKAGPEERAARATTFAKTCISQTSYANPVNSGIAGFFDRYPRYPYGRVCSYNWKNPELFAKCFPYIRKLDKCFKILLPQRYASQRAAADRLDSRFTVAGDTVFTTLTVNKTFRTAAHRDAGDLSVGFSNLGVISTGKDFTGGYLVLPEFRVAVNIRPGDLLLINNHEGIHGNTPIESVTGNPDDVERMSIVAYFREKMQELGSWEYETARRNFVESRRLNQQHPLWRPLWNGVSEKMFDSQEWYDFLQQQPDGPSMMRKHHSTALHEKTRTLGDFFV
jgi:hypothetical protein